MSLNGWSRKMVTASVLLAGCAWATLPSMAADTTIEGYISDSKCGVDHGKSGPDAACVKKCIGEGAKPVFVDDKTSSLWTIDNPDAVKGHYGHHVALTATMDAGKKSVHIDKVAMMAEQ